MRVVLVDSETELVRCNFKFPRLEGDEAQIERLAKTAASLLDSDDVNPEKYNFGAFTPYKDKEGFFVFVSGEGEDEDTISPTIMEDVLHSWSYVGYVHRMGGRSELFPGAASPADPFSPTPVSFAKRGIAERLPRS